MELLVQGQARLVCVGEQLILHLSARLFRPEMWAKLCRGFKVEDEKGDWLGAPFRVMTLEAGHAGRAELVGLPASGAARPQVGDALADCGLDGHQPALCRSVQQQQVWAASLGTGADVCPAVVVLCLTTLL